MTRPSFPAIEISLFVAVCAFISAAQTSGTMSNQTRSINYAQARKITASPTLITARTNQGSQVPGSWTFKKAVSVTCIDARSTTPKPQPLPACFITAPGYNGRVAKGQTIATSGAGIVTLTCDGQGNGLVCAARIR